jgi:hypothetical protein
MSCTSVLQNTPTWLLFVALDGTTELPITGITFNEISVSYKKAGAVSFSVKTVLTTDFREIGLGVYEILFSSAELNTLGSFIYVVNSNAGLLPVVTKQYIGQADVQSASVYTSGTITVSTNILTGNLIYLAGNPLINASVTARLTSAPSISGTSPNIGGVDVTMVSASTDNAGFFALEVLQGAEIDVIIPAINYRRTLVVPSNSTDILFTIP